MRTYPLSIIQFDVSPRTERSQTGASVGRGKVAQTGDIPGTSLVHAGHSTTEIPGRFIEVIISSNSPEWFPPISRTHSPGHPVAIQRILFLILISPCLVAS